MSASCQLTYFFPPARRRDTFRDTVEMGEFLSQLDFLMDDKRCPFSVGGDELRTPCKLHHTYPTFCKAERKTSPSLSANDKTELRMREAMGIVLLGHGTGGI